MKNMKLSDLWDILEIEVKVLRAIHHAVLNEISCSSTIPQTILDVGFGNGVFTQAVSADFRIATLLLLTLLFPSLFHLTI